MSQSHVRGYHCSSAISVGECVALDAVTSRTVIQTQTATLGSKPCIGLVASKPSSTWCLVMWHGPLGGFVGLTTGQQYFAGDNGALATSGTQSVGVADSDTTLLVDVDK
ncbi:MAG: hypothetical protein GF320_12835 [Armatimonadia bacterium]|nr:hypothetical protein [Armatimonadia bacterium]